MHTLASSTTHDKRQTSTGYQESRVHDAVRLTGVGTGVGARVGAGVGSAVGAWHSHMHKLYTNKNAQIYV